ncbi:MAG: dockerin type I domain-containing protein [Pirellulales bacterium]
MNARYSATGLLTVDQRSVLYRLDPFGEIDKVKYLNIVVSADQFGGLFPNVKVYDDQGDKLPFRVLHYSTGVEVIQVSDVEPTNTIYLSVSPSNTAVIHQVGGFELLAEYSQTQLDPTEVGTISLTPQNPIFEQPFTVNTSRLIHVLLESNESRRPSAVSAIWATLVDSNNNIIAQLGMNEGETRSLPIAFLEAGDYRVIVQAGTTDGSTDFKTQKLTISIDEISIDVGPGVINPAVEPILPCRSLGANPNSCTPVVPVVVNAPVYPNPASLPPSPIYPSIAPFSVPSWYFWPVASYHQNPLNPLDVSGDTLVTPTDALLVINLLNARIVKWDHAYDCNGDGRISPSDALVVINQLNLRTTGEGELAVANSVSTAATDLAMLAFDQFIEFRRKL